MAIKMEDISDKIIPCFECSAGKMKKKLVTYMTMMGEELISVPDFPAWVCDMCGSQSYDTTAMRQLMFLLNPNAGKPTPRKAPINPRADMPGSESRPSDSGT